MIKIHYNILCVSGVGTVEICKNHKLLTPFQEAERICINSSIKDGMK